jgi:TonB-dependent starch-binding outer membrane protein SusC
MIKQLLTKTKVDKLLCLFTVCFSLALQVQAQNKTVSGITKSDIGEILPGVNVLEKGTTNGTVSDADGNYTLSVGPSATLIFSFIGMANQEVVVGDQTKIDVILDTDITQLGEIVVVGYGTQKKSDVTGSVASVSMAEVANVPVTRPDQLLQGRVAGVQITQTNAEPGGNISIRIRGTNSITSGNQPLFVIDGFPGAGDLSTINPSDIESIDVLKDASATAIYGSRGANGVIIITTKRGKADQNTITFESYYGIQEVRKPYDLMNAPQFAAYLNDVATLNYNESTSPTKVLTLPFPRQTQIDSLGNGTNWQDAILRTAPMQNYQLGFNGGNSTTKYNLSFNYFNQEGIIINSGYERGSVRFNLDRKISDRLMFTFSSQITRSAENKALVNTNGGSSSGVILDALRISPTVPIFDPTTGAYTLRNAPLPYVEGQSGNPVAYANQAYDHRNIYRGLFNGAFEYKIMEGLKLKVSGGVDLNYGNNDSYVPSGLWFQNVLSVGAGTQFSSNRLSWLNENVLTFDKVINDVHNINFVAGFSAQKFISKDYNSSSVAYFTDLRGANNLGFGANLLTPISNASSNTLASFFGRLNYQLKNRYLLTFTMRADGSSRFGVNNKWGYFPSAAFAWKVMEEGFMSNVKGLSDLKLRVSYGITGNQEIGSYNSIGQYQGFASHQQRTDYVSGTTRLIGVTRANIANPNLSWESTAAFDVGVDMGLFNNRLQLTADYYMKKTTDLLLAVAIPVTTGYGSVLINAGSTENVGFEIGLNSVNVDRGRFKWTSNLNFSRNVNKVVDLNGEAQRFVGQSSTSLFTGGNGTTSILKPGEPIGSFFGYQSAGLWQNATEIAESGITSPVFRPGDPRYIDQNGDKAINALDRVIIGSAQPDFIYGFTNNVSYGNLSLTVLLQGVQGSKVLNLNRYELESGVINTNKLTTVLNRWTGEGTSNTIPKANSTVRRALGITDEVLEDGSFLRIKTITVGYNLPIPSGIKNVFKSANIYVTGQNVFTFTNYSGFDPEVNSFGSDNLSLNTDYNSFPSSRTFIAGIRLGF